MQSRADIDRYFEEIPQLRAWPVLAQVFEKHQNHVGQILERGYEALTAPRDRVDTTPIQLALYFFTVASFLIDDMMDHDDTKSDFGLDEGRRANLSGALLVAAYEMVAKSAFSQETRLKVCRVQSRLLLDAAAAQELEMQLAREESVNADPEKNYWKIVKGKAAHQIGYNLMLAAVLAGTEKWEAPLFDLGVTLGEMMQVSDDMIDAVYSEIAPDWDSLSANLLIVFCANADYPRRGEFLDLFKRVRTDHEALRTCRRIIIESGALGFAVVHYYQRYMKARKIIAGLKWYDAAPLTFLMKKKISTISEILTKFGVRLPDEIAKDLKLENPPRQPDGALAVNPP